MDPQTEDNVPDEITPDDLLEESREEPLNTKVGDEPLPEDNDPPAADPTPEPNDLGEETPTTDDMHPSNDTDVDSTETYQEGQ